MTQRYGLDQIGTVTNTGGTATLGGVLGDVANSSIAARLGILQNHIGPSYNNSRYLAVTADMSSATWNVFATTHEVFTVTGAVRMRIWIECTSDLTSGGVATVQFGIAGTTNGIIASTGFDDINAGYWYANTGTVALPTFGNAVMDYIVRNSVDVGYEVGTADLTGGTLIFHCVWEPMNSTGNVTAGDGSAL